MTHFLFIHSILAGDWASLTIKSLIILTFWLFMIAAVMLDLWSGVERARALGEKARSDKFRRTVTKIGDYWRVLAFALMLDVIASVLPFYNLPYVSVLAAIGCVLIEAKSVFENLKAKRSVASALPEIISKIAATRDLEQIKQLMAQYLALTDKHKQPVNYEND